MENVNSLPNDKSLRLVHNDDAKTNLTENFKSIHRLVKYILLKERNAGSIIYF